MNNTVMLMVCVCETDKDTDTGRHIPHIFLKQLTEDWGKDIFFT